MQRLIHQTNFYCFKNSIQWLSTLRCRHLIQWVTLQYCLKWSQCLCQVFFKIFAAAELHTSMKITHGTPCIDPWVQRRRRGWSYRVSMDSFP